MSKLKEINEKLRLLLEYANSVTGKNDATIGDAVKTLCDGYRPSESEE